MVDFASAAVPRRVGEVAAEVGVVHPGVGGVVHPGVGVVHPGVPAGAAA